MFKMREFADREAGRLTSKAKKVTAKAKFPLAAILALHDTIFFVPLKSKLVNDDNDNFKCTIKI